MELQNGGGWKGLLEIILSNLLAQAVLPRMVAQDHVQMAFKYLEGWRCQNPLANLCQRLVTLTVKKVFPDVQRDPPVFQCVPTGSCPVTGHH